MTATIALFSILGLCAQEDPAGLIQKLRSEKIEEREQAGQELKKLGMPALPELEKVAADKDVEVAARARTLVREIRLKDMLGIELKELQDLPASKVIEWMEKKTGRKFLYTGDLGLRNIRIRIKEELIDLADPYTVGVDLLRLAHLGVVPSDSTPGAVEVFPAPLGGKKGLRIYKSVEELPRANEFCTLLLHPRHVSPRTAQAVLINAVSFPQNCLSEEDSGTLILSDYASVLRKCAEIVNGLDVSRRFRVSVALLEGRNGKEASVPEPFRSLRLGDAAGLNQFTLLGTASATLERAVAPNGAGRAAASGAKHALRFSGTPAYRVEFAGSVRVGGGPTLDHFTVQLDQEQEKRLFEAQVLLKDDQWTVVGAVPTAEGVSLVILARAVPE